MKQFLTDTHCHLTHPEFENNISHALNKCRENGVGNIVSVGYNLESSHQCVALAKNNSAVYAVVGIHPSDAHELNEQSVAKLKALATEPKVIALGEIGLDYYWKPYDKELQISAFVSQLKLAHEVGLPVVLHIRNSENDVLEVLKQNSHLLSNGGVAHCFSQDLNFYKEIVALGLVVSVGGSLTFKNSRQLQETVKQMDLSHILLETDSPYLTPEPLRGREKNHPANTVYVAQKLAELKNLPLHQVISATEENALRVFKRLRPYNLEK